MVKTVVSIDLPIDEKLFIKKNTIYSEKNKSENSKKISIVTGIHGDQLEGQLVCFEIQKRIKAHPEFLCGTVDIFPALNPLGIESHSRTIPSFEIDMNETFPGFTDGTMAENISCTLMQDLSDSDFVIDVHASDIFVREMPQVRIPFEFKDKLISKAQLMNLDLIWAYNGSSVQENSLVYALNKVGIDSVVIDMGIAGTCTQKYCDQVTDGIFSIMSNFGIWSGPVEKIKKSFVVESKEQIEIITSSVEGIFVKQVECGSKVEKNQILGIVINPLEGIVQEQIRANDSGFLFTLREHPVVEKGSLIGRILK